MVVLLLSAGCEADTRRLDWTYSLPSGPPRDDAAVVEARLLAGGCDATAVRYRTTHVPGAPPADPMLPPELERGAWGFEVRLLTADCTVTGTGCVDVALPGPRSVHVPVDELTTRFAACDASVCSDGVCDLPAVTDGGVDAPAGDGGFPTAPCPTGFNDCDGDGACETTGRCSCPSGESCTFNCTNGCEATCFGDCHVVCPHCQVCSIACGPDTSCTISCDGNHQGGTGAPMVDCTLCESCFCEQCAAGGCDACATDIPGMGLVFPCRTAFLCGDCPGLCATCGG